MLDEVAPEHLFSQFSHIVSYLDEHGGLDGFRRLDGRLPVALDGTEYFTSRKLSCRNCSHRERGNGREYFHTMVSAAIVAPGDSRSIPLQPEFVTPQ